MHALNECSENENKQPLLMFDAHKPMTLPTHTIEFDFELKRQMKFEKDTQKMHSQKSLVPHYACEDESIEHHPKSMNYSLKNAHINIVDGKFALVQWKKFRHFIQTAHFRHDNLMNEHPRAPI